MTASSQIDVLDRLPRVSVPTLVIHAKNDARIAFEPGKAGTTTLEHFLEKTPRKGKKANKGHAKKVHLVGHSTGGVLIAHLLHALSGISMHISTCTLLAPACSVDLYNECYVPALSGKKKLKLDGLSVLNLNERLEQDDNVAKIYHKSLLYLVSNAFERADKKPLLGMHDFKKEINTIETF